MTVSVNLQRASKTFSFNEEYEGSERGSKTTGTTFELRTFRVQFAISRLWAQVMFKWHCLQSFCVKCSDIYQACGTVRYLEDTPTHSCLDYRILCSNSGFTLQIIIW